MAAIRTEARPGSKVAKMKIENDWPVVVFLPLAAVQTLGFFFFWAIRARQEDNFCSCCTLGGGGGVNTSKKSIFPIRVGGDVIQKGMKQKYNYDGGLLVS